MNIDEWISKYYSPYRSAYADRIAAAERRLSGIEKTYDYASDPLYRAYAAQFGREGRNAALDAYGDAASAVGGMNSSYALAAAEQAKSYYDSKLADKIPELWELAYDTRLAELNALKSDEKEAYSRWLDGVQQGYKLWVKEQDQAQQAAKKAATAKKKADTAQKPAAQTAAAQSASATGSAKKAIMRTKDPAEAYYHQYRYTSR